MFKVGDKVMFNRKTVHYWVSTDNTWYEDDEITIQQVAKMTGVVLHITNNNIPLRSLIACRFSTKDLSYVWQFYAKDLEPCDLVILEQNKHTEVLNKIKYLNQRYSERKINVQSLA